MKHPKGAVRTTEEMQGLLGKPVYLVVKSDTAKDVARVAPNIIRITPIKIDPSYYGYRFLDGGRFPLHVKELVRAERDYSIATESDWSVQWGNITTYYFTNFWHAYAYTLICEGLR